MQKEEQSKQPAQSIQQKIEDWKKQHPTVFALKVEDKVAYLRTPNRKEMSYAGKMAQQDPLKFNEYILSTCWLDGDKEIQNDDSYFMSACQQIPGLMEFKESTLEKL